MKVLENMEDLEWEVKKHFAGPLDVHYDGKSFDLVVAGNMQMGQEILG